MELNLKAAFERDCDLVLVRSFYANNNASKLFLNDTDTILEIQHSAMELHGESDLQIIVKRDGVRHAILIEDKVDAPAQPDQYKRYCERGDRGVQEGRWTSYSVFIAAPQKYLESDREAKKYPNKVSYEEIRDKLTDDPVSLAIIETALKKSEGLLPTVVDDAVTAFWEGYYDYHEANAPHLMLRVHRTKRGPNATWPDFQTVLKNAKILHKSERGIVDLQFRGMASQIDELAKMVQPHIASDMSIEKAGNSAVVRIKVPAMDFSKPFEIYQKQMPVVFEAINRLNKVAISIKAKEHRFADKDSEDWKERVNCYLANGYDQPYAEYFATGVRNVVGVVANDDFSLTITFDNGERRLLDMKPTIQKGTPFEPLLNVEAFHRAYISHHTICWDIDPNVDSDEVWENVIDICPDVCYVESVPITEG